MTHTVAQLAQSFSKALTARPGPEGRQQVCKLLQNALTDAPFIAATFNDSTPERHLLHEDAALGFCILAHNYRDAKDSSPHDHGPSWAIYGQVQGETVMTEWDLVDAPGPDRPGRVRFRCRYTMAPGDARVYNEGDLHSPSRSGPTRLIRIEGTNMEKVRRSRFVVA